MTTSKLFTADELLHMPDDGWRYELVEGELVQMAPAGRKHGRYAGRIGLSLSLHVENHELGEFSAAETGFKLTSNPDTVLAPDAAFVSKSRAEKAEDDEGFWTIPPDLAVEVISPNDTYAQVERKALRWIEAGCRAVVVLAPLRRTVTVYCPNEDPVVLTEEDTLDVQDVVPGWSMPLRGLFE